MKWLSQYKHPQACRFEIEQQQLRSAKTGRTIEVFYLFVFDAQGNNTHDFMQDTLEIAQEQAYEDFHVPLDSWVADTEPHKA